MLCPPSVDDASETDDARDTARWEAVEEATELLVNGAHHAALARLRQVIQLDPGNAYAFHYAGTALFELEELEPARDAYRAAVTASPKHLGARVALAHALRLLGDTDMATAEAREALRHFPDDADATFALGLALAASGDRKEAVRVLKRFLALNPEVEVQLETQGIIDALNQEPDGGPLDWK
jgi:tetratricopeptide (TPR) repeat protein